MNKILLAISLFIFSNALFAQYKLSITKTDNSVTEILTTDIAEITFDTFVCGTSTVTYSGKTYNTVQIGSQCWLKENLDVGTMIQGSQNQTNNGTIEKYCYNNDPNNCTTYGGLYQWDEAMQYVTTLGTKGICPDGWHIPTQTEFELLKTTVNSDGNALKAVGQGSGGSAGTNTSGFSALLGGNFHSDYGFTSINNITYFWHSKESQNDNTRAVITSLDTMWSGISQYTDTKYNAFSLRCIKD